MAKRSSPARAATPPPLAKSFAMLIQDLADQHHQGKLLPLAARAGLSAGTVSQWRRGITKQPDPRSIQRLCEAYELDETRMVTLVMADLKRAREGKPVALPDMSDVRPGPAPGRARGSLTPRRGVRRRASA